MASAELKSKSSLRRQILVQAAGERFLLGYNGWGLGYESVTVDGEVVERKGDRLWSVPTFHLAVGAADVRIEVRVWPWLAIECFWVYVDGEVVYAEGKEPREASRRELRLRAVEFVILLMSAVMGLVAAAGLLAHPLGNIR